jgi:quinohemoprotein ethanol dehydrogenase
VPTTWASGINLVTGRPVEAAGARYSKTGKRFLARPGPRGAHSWQPMTFNPLTALVYIPAQINAAELSVSRDKSVSRYRTGTGVNIERPRDLAPDNTELIAWDPVAQRARWIIQRDTPVASGVLSTAGSLLFQGTTSGALEAFDAGNGIRIWQTSAGSSITAAPITYSVNGTQYIAVLAGSGGGTMLEGGELMKRHVPALNTARLLAYSLSGKARLPLAADPAPVAELPELAGTPAQVSKGKELYASFCARCHGNEAFNAGPLRDLTTSTSLGDAKQWNLVTYAGLLGDSGMPGFMAELKQDEVEAIRVYVVARARDFSKAPIGVPSSTTTR